MTAVDTRPGDAGLARLRADLRVRWPELPEPIERVWSEDPVLVLDGGTPWLYGPAERDPLRTAAGHTVLPRAQQARLQQLVARGVRFPRIAVAHELDPRGPVRELLPMLRHGPRTCTDRVARALVGPLPAHPAIRRAAGLRHSAARVLDRLLDPIIFGVLAPTGPRPGEPSLFVPLVAWRW